jgi:sugar/nucleoside kinase (ribokinase family)
MTQRAGKVVGSIQARPRVMGIGLVALDVVYGLDRQCAPYLYAGGTCGNVLAALSFFGWESYPIARIASDGAGSRVRADLRECGVRLDHVALSPAAATPVVIQRLRFNSEGRVVHGFSLRCPGCGGWLPRYRAVPRASVHDVAGSIRTSEVFFVDRLSPGAIVGAEAAYEGGALVYFEPSARCSRDLFERMMAVTHVLKYSHDRAADLSEMRPRRAAVPLEVETLGADGVRYRGTMFSGGWGWRHVSGFAVRQLRDTAGAGDWATAALIDFLGGAGAGGFEALPRDIVVEGLRTAQAYAAWACGFEGPRRGMYETPLDLAKKKISRILTTGAAEESAEPADCLATKNVFGTLCGSCAHGALESTA